MSALFRFYIDRLPSSAPAKNTVGYSPTPFTVIADTESAAISKARGLSKYAPHYFSWRVRHCEELTPAEMGRAEAKP